MSRLLAIEELLGRIRRNAAVLSEYHRRRYMSLKGLGMYFDIPVLCSPHGNPHLALAE